ncbi:MULTISPECIES: sigma-70 family RNA polymerase sigma factor [Methylovorus]|jgi:RNA polymerase sigma-70 factor (ECF subfamily)|uniref:RNA polymerase sigma factor n=1 Tax=Methylovorus glucosotrophus (strain SIP3-4) TaxID=582744 RepID=C6X6P6_METGS|nr:MULTISPECIES: sigma-70 family RNA polymerase sigma factor [Methylovorus]ACT51039.1 RNA polymerase, sigma-24 subunit, ECF subfamily [Methylovorus glucosotrophus SIP3-4]ADQ84950.1 RNA polymerase, sigma-24 subunit, ECF subfamily [Methylovorus sp. MP688]KAF0843650.1 RNA polymerase sigma-70 factor (ECF subfamily) [Methylovorus glucosotrophus]
MKKTDPHAWLAEHGDYLYRFALARLRDTHQAEDVVQETLLAAMQSASYAGQSAPRTWLVGILKHKIIDLIRKQMREQPVEGLGEDLPDEPGMDEFFDEDNRHWNDKPQSFGMPENSLEQKQFLTILQDCMDRLPKKLAALFMLREVQEEENEIICKELDISSTNAWVMLYRARMGLRKCLELHWLGR